MSVIHLLLITVIQLQTLKAYNLVKLDTVYVSRELSSGDRSQVFVSKNRGIDLRSCGTRHSPCKTLELGFQKLSQGGHLYLDGQGTDQDPYACESVRGKLQVNKSFTMQNYTNAAHISCPGGVHFKASTKNVTNVHVKGITFQRTEITLADSLALFDGCTFESSTVIIKISSRLPLYLLNVSNSLFIKNKDRCLSINVDNGRCNSVVMDFQHVVFQENQLSSDALIDVRGVRVSLTSLWRNVIVKNNRGSAGFRIVRKTTRRSLTFQRPSSFLKVQANITTFRFLGVTSVSNTDMRFLFSNSFHTFVEVNNSRFHRNHINNSLGGLIQITPSRNYKSTVEILIYNSEFSHNIVQTGGALQVSGNFDKVRLILVNTVIVHSIVTNGCMVGVGKGRREIIGKLSVVFDRVVVKYCHYSIIGRNFRLRGMVCLSADAVLRMSIDNSRFSFTHNVSLTVLHMCKEEKSLDILVNNTEFIGNSAVFKVYAKCPKLKTSRMSVVNSVFLRNSGMAMKVHNIKSLNINNFTCNQSDGNCLFITTDANSSGHNASIAIEHSTFCKMNTSPLVIRQPLIRFTGIRIQNTVFCENIMRHEAIEIVIGPTCAKPNNGSPVTSGKVVLDGVEFISNVVPYAMGNLFVLIARQRYTELSVVIRRSSFTNNIQGQNKYRSMVSNLIYFRMPDEHKKLEFSRKKKCRPFPLFDYRNNIIFEDVSFENNTCYSSFMYIKNGNWSFRRCLFRENFSIYPRTGSNVLVEYGTASIEFHNTTFIQSTIRNVQSRRKHRLQELSRVMPFVYFAAKGPFTVRNSRLILNASETLTPVLLIQNAGYVYFDNKSSILCPVGSFIDLDNTSHVTPSSCTSMQCPINITRLTYFCRRCPSGFYSLERGSFHGTKKTYVECIKCPFGAKCSTNIQSKTNFWGYVTSKHPPKLEFTRCPEKYCDFEKQPSVDPSVYNSCNGDRTGTMCGSCKPGFTESLFNHECRSIHECNDTWFWVVAVLYSAAMAIYIMLQPSIVLFLVKKVFWYKDNKIPNSRIDQQKHSETGYSKIIFFFYQISVVFLVNPELFVKNHDFVSPAISLFNFDIDFIDYSLGCPFPGLTTVTKELFRSLQVFAAMAVVLVFYCLHYLACLITKKPTPLAALYVASVIEILLLGYERLAHTSLELLNCRPLSINGRTKWVLFLDGNITCWVHWWQFALIAYNVIFVVPFLVVLLIGTSKLRRQEITSLHFVAACFVPLPFLMYWIVKRFYKNTGSQPVDSNYQEIRTALLDVLQGPFRSPNELSNGALYWESVLIGRRLVLLGFRFLVASAMFRLLPMTLVIVAILVHESVVMPYKDRKANVLSVMTLSMVIVIATINLCKSALVSSGVTPNRRSKGYFEKLKFVEIFLFCILPFSVLLLAACAALSQVARLSIILFHYMKYILRRFLIPGFGNSRQTESNESERLLTCPTEELSSAETMLTYDSYLNQ